MSRCLIRITLGLDLWSGEAFINLTLTAQLTLCVSSCKLRQYESFESVGHQALWEASGKNIASSCWIEGHCINSMGRTKKKKIKNSENIFYMVLYMVLPLLIRVWGGNGERTFTFNVLCFYMFCICLIPLGCQEQKNILSFSCSYTMRIGACLIMQNAEDSELYQGEMWDIGTFHQ